MGYSVQPNRSTALLVTALLHLLLATIALTIGFTSTFTHEPKSVLRFIDVPPESLDDHLQINPPDVPLHTSTQLVPVPDALQVETENISQAISPTANSNELPDSNIHKYHNVFDPKLRKQLIESESFNVVRQDTGLQSWMNTSGATIQEVSDGKCVSSMPKINSRDMGTRWSLPFECGLSNSEKAMDRVMADYESHKSHR